MSPLFVRFPGLRGQIPFVPLGDFPTAIERVYGLTHKRVELWVKREDRSGTLYGGNKVRKLEFLLGNSGAIASDVHLGGPFNQKLYAGRGDPNQGTEGSMHAVGIKALDRGLDLDQGIGLDRVDSTAKKASLLTLGAWGSNHALAVALYGQLLGYSVDNVLFPQPLHTETIANIREHLLAQVAAHARLWPASHFATVPAKYIAAYISQRKPRLIIPSGGSCPLGTLGWVSGGIEIERQVEGLGLPPFDVVYVTVGTGGTAAGLLLGLGRAAGCIRGVRVVPWPVASTSMVVKLANQTEKLLRRKGISQLSIRPRFCMDGRFVGPGIGYGVVTQAAKQAKTAAQALGLPVETTYTGKTLAALLADAEAGVLDGKRVLFVMTASGVDLSEKTQQADSSVLPKWLRHALNVN